MFKLEKIKEISTTKLNKDLMTQFVMEYRGCKENDTARELSEYLTSRGCIFVYSKDFLRKVYGKEIDLIVQDILQNDKIVDKCILVPLVDPKSFVIGFTINYFTRSPKYKDPEEYTVKKKRMLRVSPDIIERVEEQGYLIICEGVYDELFTASLGLPVVGVGGTAIPKEMNTIINCLAPVIVVCGDNDLSGKKLWENFQTRGTKKISLKIPCNDLGEFLLKKENQESLKKVISKEREQGFPRQLIKV